MPLEQQLHKPFRGFAARSHYLSADRVDMQVASKEVCCSMSEPTNLNWKALKRVRRYLCGKHWSSTAERLTQQWRG